MIAKTCIGARTCRICYVNGVECKDCFNEFSLDEKRVKQKICKFCFSKCERCGYGRKRQKVKKEDGYFYPNCNFVIKAQ
jgi:hypothetical protein